MCFDLRFSIARISSSRALFSSSRARVIRSSYRDCSSRVSRSNSSRRSVMDRSCSSLRALIVRSVGGDGRGDRQRVTDAGVVLERAG